MVWNLYGIGMEEVWNNCGISMEDRGRIIVELNDGVFLDFFENVLYF